MAGETAAIRRLQCGTALGAAELLEMEELFAAHLRTHSDSRPVQAALDEVRSRIDRTNARAKVAAERAAARTERAGATSERVGGTVRQEVFAGVRFDDGDLRPPRSATRRTGNLAVLLLVLLAAVLVAVLVRGGGEEPSATAAGGPAETSSSSLSPDSPAGTELRVSRVEFEDSGRTWPLTVGSGALTCDPVGSVSFTADGGGTYAVNGTAKTHTSWPDIDQIWADAPDGPGPKADIGDLIDAGLALCR
jgi:hypothetical protein